MKLSRGAERPRRYAGIIFLLILVVSAGFAVSAFAAGGGEGGSKGWVSADWARVLNFAVLVLLLFVVLRKPLPKMLNNRIDGIRAELSELEAQKAEAEQKLPATTRSCPRWRMRPTKLSSSMLNRAMRPRPEF